MSTVRLGVDIGGTFTDAVMMNESTGEIRLVKMSSTPNDPSVAFINVIERILKESKVPAQSVTYNVHGTTVVLPSFGVAGAKLSLSSAIGCRRFRRHRLQFAPKLA